MAALGLANEERARAAGLRARALFRRDPRPPPIQHRKTWKLMNPAAPFSQALDRFLDEGVSRKECGPIFMFEIAIWKFMPDAETTIEEKHARVAMKAAKHSIGKVQVSLANRLPMLERSLSQRPSSITELMDSLALTRSLAQVPILFGFESHPALKAWRNAWKSGQSHADIEPTLVDIVYRCDAQDTFRSMGEQSKHHNHMSSKSKKEVKKLTDLGGGVGFQGVMGHLIKDHFKQTCTENSFYSLSLAAEPKLETMEHFMDTDGISHASNAKGNTDRAPLLAVKNDGDPRTQPGHTPPYIICLLLYLSCTFLLFIFLELGNLETFFIDVLTLHNLKL